MDPEISAMAKVAEALEDLDESTRSRVLKWASDRFDVVLAQPALQVQQPATASASEISEETSPSTHPERVLVAGYWHQVIQGQSDLTSGALNKDLKDLGYAVSNISEKFDSLMGTKPQLAIQLKKSGNSRQARKKYKITKAGIDKVNQMLGASN